jgi:hypothetical protein
MIVSAQLVDGSDFISIALCALSFPDGTETVRHRRAKRKAVPPRLRRPDCGPHAVASGAT